MDNEGRMRVFFSFHVPDDVAVRLLGDLQGLSATLYSKENLHITLSFIGDAGSREIDELLRIGKNAADHATSIRISPSRFYVADGRLRLGIKQNLQLSQLYDDITVETRRLALGKQTDSSYMPHITLGRVQSGFDLSAVNSKPEDYLFELREFGLYKSEPGEQGMGVYTPLQLFSLAPRREKAAHVPAGRTYKRIILPTRAQPDTLVAIFILKKFGESLFPGIKTAAVEFAQTLQPGESEESLDKQGTVLIDIGGGHFDHHASKTKITASELIASYLGIEDDPALAKLFLYTRRDDFYGKGTISGDPLDRAFGLSALIANLNRSLVNSPARVVDIVMPFFIAHYEEESRRTKELPQEFETKLQKGEAEIFEIRQRDKKLKAVVVYSDSGSMAGYLRSQNGGKFDIVAQWLPAGHVNVLTRPAKRVDLRSLVALLRAEEATHAKLSIEVAAYQLAQTGRMKEIPEWYYDPATNSVQNGGLNPQNIQPTRISKENFRKILELGISEQAWDPRT